MKTQVCKLFALTLLAAPLAGCFLKTPIYDERYRVFYPRESFLGLPQNASIDEIASRYTATAAMNRSIEQLAEHGFTLFEIEPLPERNRATLLRFRRRIASGRRPTNAPLEFTGVFVVEGQGDESTYLIFDPQRRGYTLHMMTPTELTSVPAIWDGRRLKWRAGQLENTIELSEDGDRMTITTDSMNLDEMPIPQSVITARRLAPRTLPGL